MWTNVSNLIAGSSRRRRFRCSKIYGESGDVLVCGQSIRSGQFLDQIGESRPDSDLVALDSFADSQR